MLRVAYVSTVARVPALLSLALLLLAACHRAGVGSPDVPRGEGATAITAFENVSVIPMDTDRVLVGQTVLVRGGVITAVGPSASVAVPRGAVRIDGSGGYLVPGLADMHVHLYDDVGLASYLANGHRAGDRGRADLGDGDLRERRAGAPRAGPRRQRVGDLGARLHE